MLESDSFTDIRPISVQCSVSAGLIQNTVVPPQGRAGIDSGMAKEREDQGSGMAKGRRSSYCELASTGEDMLSQERQFELKGV